MTDQLQRTSQIVYDNLGRKTETIDPDPATGQADGAGPKMFFAYDLDGNLRYTTDALGASSGDPGHTTWSFYDGLNRPTYVADALAFTSATA
jgi:YD repeat-containing protein